jgi:hypothetical protein
MSYDERANGGSQPESSCQIRRYNRMITPPERMPEK